MTWACKHCTCENEISCTICDACGRTKDLPDTGEDHSDVIQASITDACENIERQNQEKLELLSSLLEQTRIELKLKENELATANKKICDLKAQNIALEERNMALEGECQVCLTKAATHVVVPCAHKILCAECSIKVQQGDKRCPKCRGPAKSILKIFC